MESSTISGVPAAERIHIGFFGKRNAGKSSLINAVTGQDLSVVSDIPGTTTDPVRKTMELLPLGPVVLIDTAGFDDAGSLGELRVEKTKRAAEQVDIAVFAAEAGSTLSEEETAFLSMLRERKVPVILALTKADLLPAETLQAAEERMRDAGKESAGGDGFFRTAAVSAVTGYGIGKLKEAIAELGKPAAAKQKKVVSDLVPEGSRVILVIPVDASAPKGRIILPQQMVLRELLDHHCAVLCCQPEELAYLPEFSDRSGSLRPALVITDSQAFERVSKDVPEDVDLTSFSILLARYKGSLSFLAEGAAVLADLQDGDRVVIAEGCTHHRQCEDIGTVKLPAWIERYSGAKPVYEFTSGTGFPEDLSGVRLVVHCGGCMLNEAEMKRRIALCRAAGVPVTNYGIAIAQMKGILPRALRPLQGHF